MTARKKAAVFLLFGQSNAVGHRLPMRREDIIDTPLRNVFGLHRDDNQSFDTKELIFRGYVSAGMNLGETQDDTYSIANCLAAQWQAAKDAGEDLPDLYIVHIAIGAEGVTEKYMWYPYRTDRTLIPGKLRTANIALFPFALHVLSLLPPYFAQRGLTPVYLHHWRGGEEEDAVPIERLGGLKQIYDDLLDGFDNALGQKLPTVLHLIPLEIKKTFSPEVYERNVWIDRVFETLAAERDNVTLFDNWAAPHRDPQLPCGGLVGADRVHYTEQTNRWAASEVMRQLREAVKE
ncbi:MAG: hypothetical protein IJT18_00995 [Oscillospiraceae bacterium]|nr:hypothetical protein [Oscillospiraceae bacterium]